MNKHAIYAALRRPWRSRAERRAAAMIDAAQQALEQVGLRALLRGKGALILTVANAGYMDFVRNWYDFFGQLGLDNYLAIALDRPALTEMEGMGLRCSLCPMGRDDDAEFSAYGASSFNRITAYKILYVHYLLKLGHDVLLTDGDIVWLRNPLPELSHGADLQIQIDNQGVMQVSDDVLEDPKVCSGFFYARSNARTTDLFREVLVLLEQLPRFNDQHCLNLALHRGAHRHEVTFLGPDAPAPVSDSLSVRLLAPTQFANGSVYFSDHERFIEEGGDPLIVHANWIHGRERKIGVMTEHGLWSAS